MTRALRRFGALAALPFVIAATTVPALAVGEPDPTLDDGVGYTPGQAAASFAPHGALARDVVVQPDGRIVAVGQASFGEQDCRGYDRGFAVARWRRYGTLDETFGDRGRVTVPVGGIDDYPCGNNNGGTRVVDARARTVGLQPDGRLLVGGNAITPSGGGPALVRLMPDGSRDSGFGGGEVLFDTLRIPESYEESNAVVADVLAEPGGRIIAALLSTGYNPSDPNDLPGGFVRLRALLPSGAPDPAFGDGGEVDVLSLIHI